MNSIKNKLKVLVAFAFIFGMATPFMANKGYVSAGYFTNSPAF